MVLAPVVKWAKLWVMIDGNWWMVDSVSPKLGETSRSQRAMSGDMDADSERQQGAIQEWAFMLEHTTVPALV